MITSNSLEKANLIWEYSNTDTWQLTHIYQTINSIAISKPSMLNRHELYIEAGNKHKAYFLPNFTSDFI